MTSLWRQLWRLATFVSLQTQLQYYSWAYTARRCLYRKWKVSCQCYLINFVAFYVSYLIQFCVKVDTCQWTAMSRSNDDMWLRFVYMDLQLFKHHPREIRQNSRNSDYKWVCFIYRALRMLILLIRSVFRSLYRNQSALIDIWKMSFDFIFLCFNILSWLTKYFDSVLN